VRTYLRGDEWYHTTPGTDEVYEDVGSPEGCLEYHPSEPDDVPGLEVHYFTSPAGTVAEVEVVFDGAWVAVLVGVMVTV
jgi:hypothetical protein